MSDLVKCESCRGKKRYLGMGGIYKDCKPCGGIGYVERKLDVDTFLNRSSTVRANIDHMESSVSEPERKRMGRPPKTKE